MVNVIEGDSSLFRSAIFAPPDWNALQNLSNQYNNFSNIVSSSASEFVNLAKNAYEKMSSSTAMRTARAAANKVRSLWDEDVIKELKDICEFQNAQYIMQRWIMANPVVREKYQEGCLDGYSDSYIDMHPNDIGENHYDYRRVMSGIVIEKNDELIARTYIDEIMEDKTLTIEEKTDIINSWDRVNVFLKYGKEDPTSKWAAEL